jgi:hypothetical protein
MDGVVGVSFRAPKAGALPGCATPRHSLRINSTAFYGFLPLGPVLLGKPRSNGINDHVLDRLETMLRFSKTDFACVLACLYPAVCLSHHNCSPRRRQNTTDASIPSIPAGSIQAHAFVCICGCTTVRPRRATRAASSRADLSRAAFESPSIALRPHKLCQMPRVWPWRRAIKVP